MFEAPVCWLKYTTEDSSGEVTDSLTKGIGSTKLMGSKINYNLNLYLLFLKRQGESDQICIKADRQI